MDLLSNFELFSVWFDFSFTDVGFTILLFSDAEGNGEI